MGMTLSQSVGVVAREVVDDRILSRARAEYYIIGLVRDFRHVNTSARAQDSQPAWGREETLWYRSSFK
jgi:hypothetical protein